MSPEDRAEKVIDDWDEYEGESMRDGHRSTMRRLIAEAINEAVDAAEDRLGEE